MTDDTYHWYPSQHPECLDCRLLLIRTELGHCGNARSFIVGHKTLDAETSGKVLALVEQIEAVLRNAGRLR